MGKRCSRCKAHKPDEAFSLRGPAKPGQRVSKCKPCVVDYNRERGFGGFGRRDEAQKKQARVGHRQRQLERHLAVRRLKDAPCADCGGRFPPYCMDFDHVRGEKRANVAQLMCYSLKAILAEIAKCDLVCANCHRIRTEASRWSKMRASWRQREQLPDGD